MTGSTSHNLTADQIAAHAYLAELRMRIATQSLPFRHGDEAAALKSLHDLFGLARTIIKENPGCREFADLAAGILNAEIRPFTAMWHRNKLNGLLATRDGAVAFRADLKNLQNNLNRQMGHLRHMAYSDDPEAETDVHLKTSAAPNYEAALLGSPVERSLEEKQQSSRLAFGIVQSKLIDDESTKAINEAEAEEIRAIRKANRKASEITDGPITDTVGLALSGGGIRSATFCLGVAQVLADKKLFRDFDIMSTVSGGGYIGAFISRRLRSNTLANAVDQDANSPIGNADGPDTPEVSYLRKRAAYLSMETSWATFVAAGRILAGMTHNWTAPAFLISLVVWICLFVTSKNEVPWNWAPSIALAIAGGGLVLYALVSVWQQRAAEILFAIAVAIAALVIVAWSIHLIYLYVSTTGLLSNPLVALAPALLASLPVLSKLLPVFDTALMRKMLNAGVLVIAAVAVPAVALFLGIYLFELGNSVTAPIVWSIGNGSITLPGSLVLFGVTLILGVLASVLNINATGPHGLYRERLARTFISLSEEDQSDVPLTKLNPGHTAPYHLINTAINLPSSKSVDLRERKSDFFLFSKRMSGSPATGYQKSAEFKNGRNEMDLATAVAISGAAVAPMMALNTISPVRSLLSFLNLRLGYWMHNPKSETLLPKPVPGLWCLIREMLGIGMSETDSWFNLSDGGHIENSGIYELLRRRCRYIVAVDAGQDTDNKFGTLTTLIRHAQIDFGINIDPAFDDLRVHSETGLSPAHSVLTKINYPATETAEAGIGLLLVIKLSLTGNESELIKGYARTFPKFPHQSTADQFFDEEQFEAYRQLGTHSTKALFAEALIGSKKTPDTVGEWLENLSETILE